MKNLNCASLEEQKEFLNSFDRILCDVDGVLWFYTKGIPGSADCINALKKLGKKVSFVTNNTIFTNKQFHNLIAATGVNIADSDEVITPTRAIISLLKKLDFNKEIFVIGMNNFRQELSEAGFTIADSGPAEVEEHAGTFKQLLVDNKDVGAVIVHLDINLNFLKLTRAVIYLKRKDVLYLIGGNDKTVPLSQNLDLIGTTPIQSIVSEYSGRQPCSLGKPSEDYNKFIVELLKINDPSRVLFIGDSVASDMAFAANSGYKKLLVLSGVTKEEDVKNWKFDERYKPDYYIQDLKELHGIIQSFWTK